MNCDRQRIVRVLHTASPICVTSTVHSAVWKQFAEIKITQCGELCGASERQGWAGEDTDGGASE